MSTLFTPLTLRDVTFAHRAWMSPMMQFSGVADGPDAGTPTDWHLQHFGSRVVGGVAVEELRTEAVEPDKLRIIEFREFPRHLLADAVGPAGRDQDPCVPLGRHHSL